MQNIDKKQQSASEYAKKIGYAGRLMTYEEIIYYIDSKHVNAHFKE